MITYQDGNTIQIELRKTGYDPGTWGNAKQEFMEGWKESAVRNADDDTNVDELMDRTANEVLQWVCYQLGIEEHQLAQGK